MVSLLWFFFCGLVTKLRMEQQIQMQSAQKTDWVPGIRALCTKENKKGLYGKKY